LGSNQASFTGSEGCFCKLTLGDLCSLCQVSAGIELRQQCFNGVATRTILKAAVQVTVFQSEDIVISCLNCSIEVSQSLFVCFFGIFVFAFSSCLELFDRTCKVFQQSQAFVTGKLSGIQSESIFQLRSQSKCFPAGSDIRVQGILC